ncbi:hypothetical protein JCM11491_000730 [Sporobolomyces phaffii]
MSRSSDSSTSYDSDSSSDYEPRRKRHRRRIRDPLPASSTAPCSIVLVVLILVAAIGAVAYILRRSGGEGERVPSPAAPSGITEGPGEEPQGKPTKPAGAGKPTVSPSRPSTGTSNGTTLKLDFTTLASSDELERYLADNGFSIATEFIETEPITHTFKKENIDWSDGALRMIVRGQKGSGDISSSEFRTDQSFLYGRVTTRAKSSPVPGVCHGFFWYTNDNLEVDIEFLTSYYTEGLGYAVKPGLHFTNQALSPGEPSTHMVVEYGFDPTADFHDYTIDWSEGVSTFFVDGKELGKLEENVPSGRSSLFPLNFDSLEPSMLNWDNSDSPLSQRVSGAEPMKFVWNSWSSGEPNWSAGPPREDSFLFIESIEAEWTVSK